MTKPVFDDQMNLIGWSDDNGTFVSASSGRVESRTGPDGTVYDTEGNRLGWGDKHGTVMDSSGNIAAWSPDGMAVRSSGKIGGWVGSHADQPTDGPSDRTRDAGAIARLSDHTQGQPHEERTPHESYEASSSGSSGPVLRSSVGHSHHEPVADHGESNGVVLFVDDVPEEIHSREDSHIVQCPHCKEKLSVKVGRETMRFQCPLCQGQFTYP